MSKRHAPDFDFFSTYWPFPHYRVNAKLHIFTEGKSKLLMWHLCISILLLFSLIHKHLTPTHPPVLSLLGIFSVSSVLRPIGCTHGQWLKKKKSLILGWCLIAYKKCKDLIFLLMFITMSEVVKARLSIFRWRYVYPFLRLKQFSAPGWVRNPSSNSASHCFRSIKSAVLK